MQTITKDYISVAETAKLIRKTLKGAFPGVKFSVRSDSYSGGASIDIGWTDGPTENQVDALVQPYRGAGFDSMIDLKYYVQSWLCPDGTVTFASSPGTEGNGGVYPSEIGLPPHPDARLVSFGADHIFTRRRYSADFLRPVAERTAKRWGQPVPEVEDDSWGARPVTPGDRIGGGSFTLAELIMQDAHKTFLWNGLRCTEKR